MFDALTNIFNDLPDTLEDFVSTGYSSFNRQKSEGKAMATAAPAKASPTSGNYSAAQSRAVESEDPFAWEIRWKDRLATYAKIDRETGVKL